MKLSIIMPVYNEQATLEEIVRRVLAVDVGMAKEIVIVDDYSTDGTRELYGPLCEKFADADIRVFMHEMNQGKGAALRTGFSEANGGIHRPGFDRTGFSLRR